MAFGADAVYIGGEAFGLRAKAKNFSPEDMKKGIEFAHEHGVRVHVTANILAHDRDLEGIRSYFQELRATLDMDRNKIISMLTDAEDSASTKKEKQEATAQKMRLLNYMEQEKTVETLIKNKGLPESFVVISDSGVNVTVNTEKLDQQTVTKICEIVMRQTSVKASEIVVQDVSK